MRLAAGLDSEDSVRARGEAVRAISLPLAPAARGDDVRPMMGGVAVRETGGVGFLIAGLSHDEKKSASSAAEVEALAASPSSITTSPGCLDRISLHSSYWEGSGWPILSGISGCSLLQFLLVLGRGAGVIFRLGVLAVEGRRAAILLEELSGRLVASDLHKA